jgi:hypothetical protein
MAMVADPTNNPVLTIVSARLDARLERQVLAAYADLVQKPKPEGLLRTELLTNQEGEWQIHTLWRNHDALEAMRQEAAKPAAPALFHSLGAEPTLRVLRLEAAFPEHDVAE